MKRVDVKWQCTFSLESCCSQIWRTAPWHKSFDLDVDETLAWMHFTPCTSISINSMVIESQCCQEFYVQRGRRSPDLCTSRYLSNDVYPACFWTPPGLQKSHQSRSSPVCTTAPDDVTRGSWCLPGWWQHSQSGVSRRPLRLPCKCFFFLAFQMYQNASKSFTLIFSIT